MNQKKICLLGASGVGKTSLIKQFVEGIFSEKYLTSIGVKIDKKQVECEAGSVQFMLWDIEGIDRYCGFQPKYLRGAGAIIIVVDQTRSQSLIEGIEIFKLARDMTDIPAILAINKSDLDSTWHWDEDELKELSAPFSYTFLTSAKTGANVELLFSTLAQHLLSEAGS
ncbi:GTP-binding protein [Paraglaciecola agarilytica]|uniref:Rab family GTPase n=1 Tax=Paraglaciecola chathamensis TaxID=368405 RepID=UPI001C07F244|nr:Rab family GTPase [Paraglaciecola agarilytica]MBU3019115.1 GTP-binding protein [Paraglaciecola agarilytica]